MKCRWFVNCDNHPHYLDIYSFNERQCANAIPRMFHDLPRRLWCRLLGPKHNLICYLRGKLPLENFPVLRMILITSKGNLPCVLYVKLRGREISVPPDTHHSPALAAGKYTLEVKYPNVFAHKFPSRLIGHQQVT